MSEPPWVYRRLRFLSWSAAGLEDTGVGRTWVTALDQPAQQPVSGFGAPGIPLRVVATDTLRRLEQRLVKDRWDRDRDPLIPRTLYLAGFAGRMPVRYRLGSIGVDAADVGLVAQDARDG